MDPGEYVLIPDGEHMVVLRSGVDSRAARVWDVVLDALRDMGASRTSLKADAWRLQHDPTFLGGSVARLVSVACVLCDDYLRRRPANSRIAGRTIVIQKRNTESIRYAPSVNWRSNPYCIPMSSYTGTRTMGGVFNSVSMLTSSPEHDGGSPQKDWGTR